MSRSHHYQANDFIAPKQHEPLYIVIDKKINILYDFGVLKGTKAYLRDDPREAKVREWLKQYETERQLDVALRDVVTGEAKLNNVLKRKGLM